MIENPLEVVFRPLYGQPCWNAKSGYGSFLTMEFGQPSLIIREPMPPQPGSSPLLARTLKQRLVYPRGQWHLWIYCCAWKVVTKNKMIGHSNLKRSSKHPIERAAKELNGQQLTRVAVDAQTRKTTFAFDLGSTLETRPYDRTSDQWFLYEPSGKVFVFRGDGQYSYQSGDTRPDEKVWKPLFPMVAPQD